MKIGIAIGVIVVILALVVCLVPLKTVAYTVTVDYQDTEPLSYKDMGAEIVSTGTCYGYDSSTDRNRIFGWTYAYAVELKNTDEIAGTFTVQFEHISGGASFVGSQSIHLEPGEEGKVLSDNVRGCRVYEQIPGAKYEVIPGAKTVTKQRPETRYKEVTLLDYLLHY